MRVVRIEPTFEGWRDAARGLVVGRVRPEGVMWEEEGDVEGILPGMGEREGESEAGLRRGELRVPRAFVESARWVSAHRGGDRWGLMYRVLYRLSCEELRFEDQADPDVRRMEVYERQVRRDVHKMHAFVRFREVGGSEGRSEGGEFVAWYEPDHRIVRLAAPFFRERFSTMRWTILTPEESVRWDGRGLTYLPGIPKQQAPQQGDDLEGMWMTYYASIFNPARIKLKAMEKEMPRRFWKNLPEAQQLQDLLAEAPTRVEEMMARSKSLAKADAYPSSEVFIPKSPTGRLSLPQLAEAAVGCRGCPICELGTRTVFGEGPERARLVLVGEQPGDNEDLQGRPFVGPAGQLLDEVLAQVGLPRDQVYVTNAVKHFKFEAKGSRRIHAKPTAREILACKPWLVAELQIIRPRMIVALGATAAQAMMGPGFRVTQSQGEIRRDTEWAPWWMATIHPSVLLRIPDAAQREKSHQQFVSDLKKAAEEFGAGP